MALYQELILNLNADCAEFCTDPEHYGWLAVGTYQLDEATSIRHGRLYLYSLLGAQDQQHPHLRQLTSVNVPGIFDLQWAPLLRPHEAPNIGLALADGTLRIVAISERRRASASEGTALDEPENVEDTVDQLQQPQGDSYKLQELCSGQAVADSMALFLDWNPHQHDLAAVSSSAGTISIMQVHDTGLQQCCEWTAHDLETWIASWDRHKPTVLYSGSDDSTFKGWDIRLPTSNPSSSSSDSLEPHHSPIFSNRRAHAAGVTCISSHPRQEHVLVTGSYDENVRLWDVRMIQKPVQTCQVSTGGGVWRLKWHPHRDHLLLAACMYQGFALVSTAEDWSSLQVIEKYKGHESIAYGADWYKGRLGSILAGPDNSETAVEPAATAVTEPAAARQFTAVNRSDSQGEKVSGQECKGVLRKDIIATCSFYDRRLHLWSPAVNH